MSDISSANFSLDRLYALTKQHPPSTSADYIAENHPLYEGADWVARGTTTRLNKNRVAVKVLTTGTAFAPSITCTVNPATHIATSATDGGYISMNEATCSIAMQIWVRSKTNLV